MSSEKKASPSNSISKYKTFLSQGSSCSGKKHGEILVSESPLIAATKSEFPSPLLCLENSAKYSATPVKKKEVTISSYQTPVVSAIISEVKHNDMDEYWTQKLNEIRSRIESREGIKVSTSVMSSIEKTIVKRAMGDEKLSEHIKRKISELPSQECELSASKRHQKYVISESPLLKLNFTPYRFPELETPKALANPNTPKNVAEIKL